MTILTPKIAFVGLGTLTIVILLSIFSYYKITKYSFFDRGSLKFHHIKEHPI